jgi:hypothetical protein
MIMMMMMMMMMMIMIIIIIIIIIIIHTDIEDKIEKAILYGSEINGRNISNALTLQCMSLINPL